MGNAESDTEAPWRPPGAPRGANNLPYSLRSLFAEDSLELSGGSDYDYMYAPLPPGPDALWHNMAGLFYDEEFEPPEESEEEEEEEEEEERESGYDYEFVGEASLWEDYQCPICLHVAREPTLTSCCGKHFCQSCIDRVLRASKPCPCCKQNRFSVMLDKSALRKVNELRIRCPYGKHGCEWEGELKSVDGHIDKASGKCSYVEAPCPLCTRAVPLCDMTNHKSSQCPRRPHTCEHCGKKSTHEQITGKHSQVCDKYPVQCPNACGAEGLRRGVLEKHLEKDCPLMIVDCKYSFAGCAVQLPRKDLPQHLQSETEPHLSMVADACVDLQQELEEKEERICKLEREMESMRTALAKLKPRLRTPPPKQVSPSVKLHVPTPPRLEVQPPLAELVMENFYRYKDRNLLWYSKAFYTGPVGYRMCLSVFAGGIYEGEDTHVSVYVNLVCGQFDHKLVWPFKGKVYVEISDLFWVDPSFTKRTFVFDPSGPERLATLRVCKPCVRNETGVGFATCIPHSLLFPLARVSSLKFVVARVEC